MTEPIRRIGYPKVVSTDNTTKVLKQFEKSMGIKFPKTKKKQNNELPKDPTKAINEQYTKLRQDGYTEEDIKILQKIQGDMRKN